MSFGPARDRVELPADTFGDLLDEARQAVSTLFAVSTIPCIHPEVYTATRQLAHRLEHATRTADDELQLVVDTGDRP